MKAETLYTPGLHLLLNMADIAPALLQDARKWDFFIRDQVFKHALQQVGQVLHSFPEGGFTAVHALTESHVSIHTWPEYGTCTCDIFLSNFRRNNHDKVRAIGRDVLAYFNCINHKWSEQER